MAAFSYQPHPLLLDPIFLPNTLTKISGFMEEGNFNSNCFSQFYPPEPVQESPLDPMFHESSCLAHSSKVAQSDNEPSVTKKQSTDDSTVLDKLESGEQVTQNVTPANRKRRTRNGFALNSAQSKSAKEEKSKRQKKSNEALKIEKKESKAEKKDEKKSPEVPPAGYIHVRARRGQATDSHSLAERVRREKISERMRILQRLVPGCDKVTGKAFMLDEIINYVQSLQNQVEFLSMKLASMNPVFCDFGVDLEALMFRPERVDGVASPVPSLQRCNPTQPTAFVDSSTAIFAPANNYPLLDASAALLLHQGQRPIVFSQPQDNGSVLWDVEDQRQKLLNSSGLNDNLGCFH